MHWNSHQDGIGLDLSPFVTAANTAADVYAKTKAADAALAAAKARPAPAPAPAAGGSRKPNWLAYLLMGGVAVGGFLVVRKLMKRRGRR